MRGLVDTIPGLLKKHGLFKRFYRLEMINDT
jgi:hypothetical protein